MAEKPKKDSINMNKYIILGALLIVLIFSCGKNNVNPDPIDNVPVNITINMALPSYSHLLDIGSHVYEAGGVKGVVVVHAFDDQYYALDRTCSHQPRNDCSKVELDSSSFQFRCGSSQLNGFQKCCDSRFSLDGSVTNGPATFGLKMYSVSKSGNLLNIKN
jgi:nitrite reductase/ring-hydroxylating ferredoxin subunit